MNKYESVAEKLTKQIVLQLQKGIRALPTEAELCRQYQVSRQTIRTALALLRSQNIIESRQGSGSFATGIIPGQERNVIPILISSEQEYIYPALLDDIRNVLAGTGYQLQVYPTGNDTSAERRHLLSLLEAPPRGMIVEGCKSTLPNPNLHLYEKLRQNDVFVLFLHNYYTGLPDSVYVKDDNHYGGYLLAKHLLLLGHTRISCLLKMDDMQGPERYLGIASSLRDFGYELEDRHVGWFTTLELTALEKKQDTRFLTRYIREQMPGCSAVICYNDEIAYWLIRELSYAGFRVPDEISVVCFDNSYLSDLSRIRITTLTHEPREMGENAAGRIVQKLKGIPVTSLEIPWRLLPKNSDAPYQP